MFTGIVEEIGKIISITQNQLVISANTVLTGTKLGDSIAVNGICLTVTDLKNNCFVADISPETYNVTSLKYLKSGCYVNLERAMPADGRFGGHIVSGHIDNIGKIKNLKKNGNFYDLEIEIPQICTKYVIKKGSIAINGISLTVAEIVNNSISIAIIPHTFEMTALKILKAGDFVNIETDILAKYVEKILSTSDNRTGISIDFLKENGF